MLSVADRPAHIIGCTSAFAFVRGCASALPAVALGVWSPQPTFPAHERECMPSWAHDQQGSNQAGDLHLTL